MSCVTPGNSSSKTSSLVAAMTSEDGGVSIALPDGGSDGDAFRNLRDAKIFAMDIGGSLAKIAYYSTVPCK